MMEPVIGLLVAWNILGALFIMMLTINCSRLGYFENILNPVWIYRKWNLNYFGTGLVCMLFNFLCPIWTISVWTFKFLYFICTVGRR